MIVWCGVKEWLNNAFPPIHLWRDEGNDNLVSKEDSIKCCLFVSGVVVVIVGWIGILSISEKRKVERRKKRKVYLKLDCNKWNVMLE